MASTNGVPQPFPYQGSKRRLAACILRFIPSNSHRLVEPFAGSAAVSLAAAKSRRASRFFLADANEPLTKLWKEIVMRPDELCDRYEKLWTEQEGQERTFYDEVRKKFNQNHRPEHLLYLLARCVKAAIRYNSNGEFNNSPDNRRRGMRPETMRHNLVACSHLLNNRVQIEHADYREVLQHTEPDDVVYMDPPYQGVCGKRDARYLSQTSLSAFSDSLRDLNRREVPFIVSYDGRRGDKTYGKALPEDLDLIRHEVDAGRSTTSTLLGRAEKTYESLYLSPALAERIADPHILELEPASLFADFA